MILGRKNAYSTDEQHLYLNETGYKVVTYTDCSILFYKFHAMIAVYLLTDKNHKVHKGFLVTDY